MEQKPIKKFTKDFTQQEPIADEAIDRVMQILRSGRIHRYNVAGGELSEASLLEREFADYLGVKFCLTCASCGMAMYLALKSAGVKKGDTILCNSFTLAPVPGAIHNAGGKIELVEITEDYTVDLQDLEKKAADPSTKWFLISHMRGHLTDMEKVVDICQRHEVVLIEDCAHTMGASWNSRKSGTFGKIACFSTQTYKHLNSGEGGLLTTNDPEIIAKAILYSGSYMLFDRHLSRPKTDVFEQFKKQIPNYSCRMDNMRAAILRYQLKHLDNQCKRWNERYQLMEQELNKIKWISCPRRPQEEYYVGSSIQFSLNEQGTSAIQEFISKLLQRGVEIKWFGNVEPVGFTSAYSNWEYLGALPVLENTDRILAGMCDMRIPLTFDLDDCQLITQIIADVATEVFENQSNS
ncbi:MAG: aminotransferase class I/II-fold pyridoxal phosphate-dependent enzyme [Desulfocapsaceae bacterium]|nr:aminotransferase class I/II-fold pyridoxal phosphate-dependent enzyme [Desulfocapsaceae bacterium]